MTETLLRSITKVVVLELGREGKFVAKSGAWEDNRVMLKGDVLEIRVDCVDWLITRRRQRSAANRRRKAAGQCGRGGRGNAATARK
jgi:hypothetical protein